MSIFTRSRSHGLVRVAVILMASAGSLWARTSKNQAPRDPAQYDAWLMKEVRHQLVLLPWLTIFDNLEYKVEGTKVVLMGQVVRPVLKEDAGRAVKGIEGVTEVDNQIQVLPPSPMDWETRRAEYRAIYGFADLWKYAMGALPPVHIVVDNSRVTLDGIVDSQADKNLIELRAKTVPNLFSVTNNLEVAPSGR